MTELSLLLSAALYGAAVGFIIELVLMIYALSYDFHQRFVFKDGLGRGELLLAKLGLVPEFLRREYNWSYWGLARGTVLFVLGGALAGVFLAIFAVGLQEVIVDG